MKSWLLMFALLVVATFSRTATAQDAAPAGAAFSNRVEALPFPPDAREIVFHDTFDMVRFQSGSSLNALAAFYRREMKSRGWTEDADVAENLRR